MESRQGASDGDVTMAALTDVMFRMPAVRVAGAHTAWRTSTYMYLFTWPNQSRPRLGAHRALELPFVFGTLGGERARELVGKDPPPGLSEMMQDAWLAFARTGNPNTAGAPEWRVYDSTDGATMVLDVNSAHQ